MSYLKRSGFNSKIRLNLKFIIKAIDNIISIWLYNIDSFYKQILTSKR